MRRKAVRVVLIVMEVGVAVLGIGGGLSVATGVDTFPASWLTGTPFTSYLVPGLILAVAVGGSAVVAAIAMLGRRSFGPRASFAAGVVLMGWITGEALILRQPAAPTAAEVVFFFVGW